MGKKIYIIIFFAILLCIILLYLYRPSNKLIASEEIITGNITLDILSPTTDEYIPDAYDNVKEPRCYVSFTNPELIYEIFTLEALSNICEDTSNFLNTHGYSDVHSLTILPETIIYERAYPRFICKIDENENTYLEIRYDIESQLFEYQIL
ncbi:MAG: hypothetical protein UHN47_06990 [Lachnospiraceae bacterium]|nr:hypothetical protein [Lachnospiraceae bacterium]